MKFDRSGGVLLHPSSLPGPYGIGDLGPQAYRFVDWLASTGCKLWQVLPLGPTGYGDSHYSSATEDLHNEFNMFRQKNSDWLEDYALFMSLKEANGGGAWNGWDETLRKRNETALKKAREDHEEMILRYSFYQFLFFRQWNKLHAYAREKGIKIIGDIPIFIAYDSADAWAHPELFFLGEDSLPTVVAGVPPDYFSATGQLWGNPLYRWDVHKKAGYAWWLERFRSVLNFVDVVRLDHFRGFAGYYEIPFGAPTAETGQWMTGPGKDFFKTVSAELSDAENGLLPIIAEDLGVITPDVVELRDSFSLPGMKILQFGFTSPSDPFLPHNYTRNCVAYTGTHDNDTALGWYASAPEAERKFALRYLNSDGTDFAWDLIRGVWSSVAAYAVAPMQDLLSLRTEARMNFPSRLGGNWEWRMSEADMSADTARRLREFNELYWR